MNPLRAAFKEWAVICKMLALGRQAVLLRKGGIAEAGGAFTVEHTRFWLYPTYAHQHGDGIVHEALPLLEEAERERPPVGVIRLSHFAEVPGVYHTRDLAGALRLAALHAWSPETVEARFRYGTPGLFVLPVRVYRVPEAVEVPELPEYAGCRSWVDLGHELPTAGATPVLTDAAFEELLRTLDRLLQPTAWV
jgi:hypothetical protein